MYLSSYWLPLAMLATGNCSFHRHSFHVTGKSVGIVTTSRVTHATPGAAYAHTPERDWESDANIKNVDPSCVTNKVKDIALQLIEDNPNIQVLLF